MDTAKMIIGIPRALLYHRYHCLWETFFEHLNLQVVVSRETDKAILERGGVCAIDEACLSSKIYLGHVESLLGRCDLVFVPRVSNFGQRDNILCTKFEALPDIVSNTFRHRGIKLLDCNIDGRQSENELSAFMLMRKKLGKKRFQTFYAYMLAKQAEKLEQDSLAREQERRLEEAEGLKLLIVGHSYNVYDKFIGGPILHYLKALGATPIIADRVDRKRALSRAAELTSTMPWLFNRELTGAVQECREKVDGLILLSAFPCGPDSLANEILLRRVSGLPTLNLLVDSQEGAAGIETRLESFIDIIGFRQAAKTAKEASL
jgi:predicted nucleotide-binding protein (sugar kinase/HSP70/actin superfamily)